MSSSSGDPRVLFVMNLVLSSLFAAVVVWGLSVVDAAPFRLRTVAGFALVVMVLTHLVVMR
jgi:hypothetical protein